MNTSDAKSPRFVSPKKKNPRGKPVKSGQKIIIVNHYKSILENDSKMKFREMITNISETTGFGYHTVRKTIAKYKTTKCVTSPNRERQKPGVIDKINDFVKNAIRRKVHSFWLNRELPTLPNILIAINNDETLPNFKETSFRIILKSLKFKFTKCKRYNILMERSDLVCWRRKYLSTIRRFREEERPIYYLDETCINTRDCASKIRIDQTVTSHRTAFLEGLSTNIPNPTDKGKRLIVLHIGSVDGFVRGGLLCFDSKKNSSNCHDEINGQTFKEWFEEILPLLKDNAVVVMDNEPYHSIKSETVPTMNWKKTEIVNWLHCKGEDVDPSTTVKSNLMEIVNRLKPKYNSYAIDDIAKEAGKSILRLPPYHCELNPMELVWSKVKDHIKSNSSTLKTVDEQHLLHQAIDRVTSEDWQNFISKVKDEEQKMWEVDYISDELIDGLQSNPNHAFNIDNTSESSDS